MVGVVLCSCATPESAAEIEMNWFLVIDLAGNGKAPNLIELSLVCHQLLLSPGRADALPGIS